jgi:hypothetical protein
VSAVFLTALLVVPLIAFPAVSILGWGHKKAREYLTHAADAALHSEYKAARQYMINATRFLPTLKSSQPLVAFYEKVVAGTSVGTDEAADIKNLAKDWPLSLPEKIWTNNAFKLLFFAFIALSILVPFASLPK